MTTPQQRAAETRRKDRDATFFYENFSKPAHTKVEKLLNHFLLHANVRVRMVGPFRLKGGVTEGRLMKISNGGLCFTVHIDGYKHVKNYASWFCELLTNPQPKESE